MLPRRSLRCCPQQTRFPFCKPRLLSAVHSIPRPESTLASPLTSDVHPVSVSPDKVLYQGPLTATFKRLKLFSLSSLSLSVSMAPLMFAVETNLPWSARAFLAGTAVSTSAVSTALIAWAGRSYVTALRVTKAPADDAIEQLEITTMTFRLRPRITRVSLPGIFSQY